jgi:hypothetical protein
MLQKCLKTFVYVFVSTMPLRFVSATELSYSFKIVLHFSEMHNIVNPSEYHVPYHLLLYFETHNPCSLILCVLIFILLCRL